MNSEELSKKVPQIKKELNANPPSLWIEFSVPKSNLSKATIPDEAKTTPKKVFLYLNAGTGEVDFDTHGEPYTTDARWTKWFSVAQYSDKYECIILSNWTDTSLEKLQETHFKGTAPFKAKDTMKLNYFLLVNGNKDLIGIPTKYDYRKSKFVEYEGVKIGKLADFTYDYNCYYNYLFDGTCINMPKMFRKLFKVGLIGGNNYITFDTCENISKFLSYDEPVVRNTPKQNLVNELLKTTLKVPKMTFNKKSENKLICVASKVNEEYSALRWFIEDIEGKPYEISRLFVNKKTHVFCRKNTKGDYVVLNNKLVSSAFDSQKVMIQDKDAFTGTKLEYFVSIYKDLKPSQRGSALYMLTVYPEFEKMYKSDFKNICTNYLNSMYKQSWPNYLKDIFGTYNPKEKNLTKMFGFNKYQLERVNVLTPRRRYWYSRGVGSDLKEVLKMEDCSSIDNATFDLFFDVLSSGDNYYIKNALIETMETYSLKVCINMIPTLKAMKDVSKTIEMTTPYGYSYRSSQSAISLYIDYVRTVRQLGAASTLRPHFDTFEDIHRMHDDAAVVFNMKRDAIETEKFMKRSEFWKKWEYEEDDNFVVIAPTKPEDLATEGITLHHCVKSYIQRVSDGATNIMFIRKKGDTSTPFFTVEVGNKGTIEQVHGLCNRNADTEPGLEDFVKKWAKSKKLSSAGYNKVR